MILNFNKEEFIFKIQQLQILYKKSKLDRISESLTIYLNFLAFINLILNYINMIKYLKMSLKPHYQDNNYG